MPSKLGSRNLAAQAEKEVVCLFACLLAFDFASAIDCACRFWEGVRAVTIYRLQSGSGSARRRKRERRSRKRRRQRRRVRRVRMRTVMTTSRTRLKRRRRIRRTRRRRRRRRLLRGGLPRRPRKMTRKMAAVVTTRWTRLDRLRRFSSRFTMQSLTGRGGGKAEEGCGREEGQERRVRRGRRRG